MQDTTLEKPTKESQEPSSPEKQRKPPRLHEDEREPQVDRSGELPARESEGDEDQDEHQRGTD